MSDEQISGAGTSTEGGGSVESIGEVAESTAAEEQSSQEVAGEEESQSNGEQGEYTFTLPEGKEVDQERMNEYAEFAKASGMSQESAQKSLDYFLGQADQMLQDTYAAQMKAYIDQQVQEKQAWEKSYPPEKRREMEVNASRTLDGAPDEVKQLFEPFDQDNNPNGLNLGNKQAVIEWLSAIGADMAEGTHVSGAPGVEKSRGVDRLYGKTTPAKRTR